tara:strand:- start:29150 stop:29281 length:132 start_codon:yes stop_codon:yes gene_type:complete
MHVIKIFLSGGLKPTKKGLIEIINLGYKNNFYTINYLKISFRE